MTADRNMPNGTLCRVDGFEPEWLMRYVGPNLNLNTYGVFEDLDPADYQDTYVDMPFAAVTPIEEVVDDDTQTTNI